MEQHDDTRSTLVLDDWLITFGPDTVGARLSEATENGYVKSIEDRIFKAVVVRPRPGQQELVEKVRAVAEGAGVPFSTERWDANVEIVTDLNDDDDAALADRALQENLTVLRFMTDTGRWLAWDGKRWVGSDSSSGRAAAKKAVSDSVIRFAQIVARTMVVDSHTEPDPELRQKARKRAAHYERNLRSNRSLSGIWSLMSEFRVRRYSQLLVTVDDLDRDPWLLNTPSGMVDLRTGALLEHDPDKLCTSITRASYDPDAQCPTWLRFLEEAQPDPEIRAYLKRRTGAALVGEQREHVFHIDLGIAGRNGKSTFHETILSALGSGYGTAADSRLLLVGKDRHQTEIAKLRGKRYTAVEEARSERQMDGALVKRLTGGSRREARRMREDPWDYVPTDTLILSTNDMPSFDGGDQALGARMLVVPWRVTFSGREDVDLKNQLLAEIEGVLAWAVQGAVEYAVGGLQPPQTVLDATKEERDDSDPFSEWADGHLQVVPGARSSSESIHADWVRHRRTGKLEWTKNKLTTQIRRWLESRGIAVVSEGAGGTDSVVKTKIKIGGRSVQGFKNLELVTDPECDHCLLGSWRLS